MHRGGLLSAYVMSLARFRSWPLKKGSTGPGMCPRFPCLTKSASGCVSVFLTHSWKMCGSAAKALSRATVSWPLSNVHKRLLTKYSAAIPPSKKLTVSSLSFSRHHPQERHAEGEESAGVHRPQDRSLQFLPNLSRLGSRRRCCSRQSQ